MGGDQHGSAASASKLPEGDLAFGCVDTRNEYIHRLAAGATNVKNESDKATYNVSGESPLLRA